ncbi:LrgB family protein [Desmospora profundinema]|uniref:Murein hydrolase (TIGR00659 family) n=1 Tax=Desmospora profundinema TaxID=1571184 RepID=A0ABU1ISP8_9BACL|nr:LrgB family protein [Desmospora profundinema]MDR6227587.1 putative murein hydrolase (TIGR00659 family) [Desmospora profundinema]
MNTAWGAAVIIGTVTLYRLFQRLYRYKRHPVLTPVATAGGAVIGILLVFSIPYETYMIGGQWIDALLGPAVVALALPLYRNRQVLKRYFVPIVLGVVLAAGTAIANTWIWSRLLGWDPVWMRTLLPQSVTSPVAVEISRSLGGLPSLTAAVVILAGVIGAATGPLLFRWLTIDDAVARGMGYGCAAHGIGTARAMEDGEVTGAASSVAMTLAAVVTSVLCAWLF